MLAALKGERKGVGVSLPSAMPEIGMVVGRDVAMKRAKEDDERRRAATLMSLGVPAAAGAGADADAAAAVGDSSGAGAQRSVRAAPKAAISAKASGSAAAKAPASGQSPAAGDSPATGGSPVTSHVFAAQPASSAFYSQSIQQGRLSRLSGGGGIRGNFAKGRLVQRSLGGDGTFVLKKSLASSSPGRRRLVNSRALAQARGMAGINRELKQAGREETASDRGTTQFEGTQNTALLNAGRREGEGPDTDTEQDDASDRTRQTAATDSPSRSRTEEKTTCTTEQINDGMVIQDDGTCGQPKAKQTVDVRVSTC